MISTRATFLATLLFILNGILLFPSCANQRPPDTVTTCILFPPELPKTAPEPPKREFPEVPYCVADFGYPLSEISAPVLYVLKKHRRLLLVDNGILVRKYRIALGSSPRGDKSVRGDGRTPEGDFVVCRKNGNSKYYKSLGLNYPTPRHALQALDEGLISLREYNDIMRANRKMHLPPPNTLLGGAIFIHGGGEWVDWTEGCIALNDRNMDELYRVITLGTPVKILP